MKLSKILVLAGVLLMFAPAALAEGDGPVIGKVAETMESGGYVYIKLEDGPWIAASPFPVAVGDTIQYRGGMEMNNFHSNTLNRSFESILFVSQVGPVAGGQDQAQALPAGHGSEGMQMPQAASVPAPSPGDIAPLAGGKTVAGILAEPAQLKGQVVSLNAKVVKVSANVMGKNWVTLQDGTGTEPDDKLLATSQETVEPGAMVTVKGTVNTDVDLGYGYKYEVLLEEASFTPVE